jgi:hypothetical protein
VSLVIAIVAVIVSALTVIIVVPAGGRGQEG